MTSTVSFADSVDVVAFARRWAWQLMAAATTFVIVWAALRGISAGYQPVGDNALIELRARDVFTGDHPLLGTWSSASISAGIDVNHPGPLLFDLVAIPLRVFGGAAGVALAVMALHVAVVWTVGWVAHRLGGQTAAIATMTVTALIVWTLGSELLYDPWQPNVLVLPFWLFMCVIWAIVAGETALFPLACGVGSFCMQTHLGYLLIVPILLAFAATMVWRSTTTRNDLQRPALQSVAVILVLWAQPLWEQLFGPGRGNLGRMIVAGSGGGDDFEAVAHTRTGVAIGIRMLGSVVALPPWWGRPGYDDAIPSTEQTITPDGQLEIDTTGLSALGPAVLGLLVVIGMLAGAWWLAHRSGERRVTAGLIVLCAALVIAMATLVITPIDILGLSPHKVRWLWVIGAFSTLMITMAVLAALGEVPRHRAVAALAGLAAIALIATLPTHVNESGPAGFGVTHPSIESLRDQVEQHLESTPLDRVLFDADGIGFAEPYTAPIMAELLENGVDLVVADRSLSRQLGPDRLAEPDDLRPVVFVRAGAEALDIPAGTVRIAFHDGDRTPFSVNNVTDRAVGVFVTTGEPT